MVDRSVLGLARYAWTGGDTPPARYGDPVFRAIRSIYFREFAADCGGLGRWECAGTSALERARIFWNQATLNAWRTSSSNQSRLFKLRQNIRNYLYPMSLAEVARELEISVERGDELRAIYVREYLLRFT